MPSHFISKTCEGQKCGWCYIDATHKVGEEIPRDDPQDARHNYTAYVCCRCFRKIFGDRASRSLGCDKYILNRTNIDVGMSEIANAHNVQLELIVRDAKRTTNVSRANQLVFEVMPDNELRAYEPRADHDYLVLSTVRYALGYTLRRAICRGLDKSDVDETASIVRIDFGRMP